MSDRPAHIGYVVNHYPRLSETFILHEILELERRGVAVTIFSLRKPDEGRFHPAVTRVRAPVVYLEDWKAKKWWRRLSENWTDLAPSASALWSLLEETIPSEDGPVIDQVLLGAVVAAQVKAWGIDALHAHFANTSCSVAHFAHRICGVPYSFTAHAKDIFADEVDSDLLAAKIAAARFVVTVSEFNHRYLTGRFPATPPDHIRVLYNGVDLDFFSPDETAGAPGDNLILAVGRLVAKKGFADLVRACALLRDRGVPFTCRIVGQGREEATLRELCDNLDLNLQVILPGPENQEEVRGLLRRATVLCQPCIRDENGNQDALPTVLLESLACGTPAVSTRLVGIPEIIASDTEGLLVEPADPVALADAIQRVLTSPALRAQFAHEGRRKAELRFDVKKNVAVLHALLLDGIDPAQPPVVAAAGASETAPASEGRP